jgi:hypothetical protein
MPMAAIEARLAALFPPKETTEMTVMYRKPNKKGNPPEESKA